MSKLTKDEMIKMRIKRVEKEIRDTPYHKGTEHHIGRLRAKLSKLKENLEGGHSTGSGSSGGYGVRKQGDATVVLVGPPSVGKSTLLNRLTNAQSKIAPYAFTTVTVIPGMMDYKDAKIQILDVPGLIEGAEEGKGRGREVLSVVRACDLMIIMADVEHLSAIGSIKNALERNGIRINKTQPKVSVEKMLKGGVVIHSNIRQDVSVTTIKEIADELGYKNCEITIKEKINIEQLIDVFSANRIYIPAMTVINKIDQLQFSDRHNRYPEYDNNGLKISAETGEGIETLKEEIWNKLEFIRIYLVREDEEPGFNHPMIMKKGQLLCDVTEKIGSEFSDNKKRAKTWGTGSKFPGQEVSLTTPVQEGMQVRFI